MAAREPSTRCELATATRRRHLGTVLAPCGGCREFISQLSPHNLDTKVLVTQTEVVGLGDLMPYRWLA